MAALARVPTAGGRQHRYLVERHEEFPGEDATAVLAARRVATERAKSRLRAEGADQGRGYRVLHLFLLSLLVPQLLPFLLFLLLAYSSSVYCLMPDSKRLLF